MKVMRQPIMKLGVIHWKCTACKQVKKADSFYTHKHVYHQCKNCIRKASNARELFLRKRLREGKPPQSDRDLLKSLQSWDPSWDMAKLKIAMADSPFNKRK